MEWEIKVIHKSVEYVKRIILSMYFWAIEKANHKVGIHGFNIK